MGDKKETPKHSVGEGAQKEHHNTDAESSYVEDPKESKKDSSDNDDDYLEQKWKKISSDFREKYNLDVKDSEYKSNSFSEVLKNLENRTGKSRDSLEDEIKNWKD